LWFCREQEQQRSRTPAEAGRQQQAVLASGAWVAVCLLCQLELCFGLLQGLLKPAGAALLAFIVLSKV
jgi:hypothetical protein